MLKSLMKKKIKIGISACLTGKRVRYDGSHRLDRSIKKWAGRSVKFIPVCPEVECGLPVPREPMILKGDPHKPRLITINTGIDHTERLRRWLKIKLKELKALGISGFIFKSRSPSCGLKSVKLEGSRKKINGLFADAIVRTFPEMPVIEDLHDPETRRKFKQKIRSYSHDSSS